MTSADVSRWYPLDGLRGGRLSLEAIVGLTCAQEVVVNPEGTIADYGRQEAVRLAYDLGHRYELEAHYCPQASLAALMDVFHLKDDVLFKAVFGFHGGSGNTGIGPCGALVGGIAALGLFFGRSRQEFDLKVENCTATPLVAQLVDRFKQEFGGISCRDCQRQMFGREIDFSLEEDRRFFEKSGGHDKCAQVVGRGSAMAAEILWDALRRE